MTALPKDITDRLERFMAACEAGWQRHPALVVVLMHELFRNMYPTDPYIPRPVGQEGRHPLEVCADVLDRGAAVLGQFEGIGAYAQDFAKWCKDPAECELKEATGKVYGALWNEFPADIVDEATAMLRTRLVDNGVDLGLFAGKRVLDAGCGSGRYSIALSRLGAGEVVGVDFGDGGLAFGNRLIADLGVANVTLRKGSLLDLPFSDESFDFVYANGTIHHTGDIPRGTREAFRVLRKGGAAWYYVYGAGGLFWTARRLMNTFMKKIPQGLAMEVLRLIGMPRNRFIFCDTWYVPIEAHSTKAELEQLFAETGFTAWTRCSRGVATDIDWLAQNGTEQDRLMWGEGDHRYILGK